MSIPGIKNLGADVIVSEIGIDMSRFPSDAHLISWACICPRNDESAGKRRSNRLRKGGTWLKTTLVQCAWAAARDFRGSEGARDHTQAALKKTACGCCGRIQMGWYDRKVRRVRDLSCGDTRPAHRRTASPTQRS
jgi:transposase